MYLEYFRTDRLKIIKADMDFLKDYYHEFTDGISKYQYPDTFKSITDARSFLSNFLSEMDKGNLLELMILDSFDSFIGILEAIFIQEDEIELGLWIKSSAQGLGYGYEALNGLINYLKGIINEPTLFFEVDDRNEKSKSLISKFDLIKSVTREEITESNKKLILTTYYIK